MTRSRQPQGNKKGQQRRLPNRGKGAPACWPAVGTVGCTSLCVGLPGSSRRSPGNRRADRRVFYRRPTAEPALASCRATILRGGLYCQTSHSALNTPRGAGGFNIPEVSIRLFQAPAARNALSDNELEKTARRRRRMHGLKTPCTASLTEAHGCHILRSVKGESTICQTTP